jgi:Protein of unknown function (DUF3040)
MGTRDEASLSPQERAALAGLEARAVEDDPGLAARLAAGSRRFRLRIPAWVPGLATRLWFGPLLIMIGLLLVLISLSVSLALGVVGALVTAAGLACTCHAWVPRLRRADGQEDQPA